MSDRSDTSSVSGEWERKSECSCESAGDDRLSLIEKVAKLEEENRIQKRENDLLKSQIKHNEAVFTLNKWMEDDIEGVKSSNGRLHEKTMEVYKAIWEKEGLKLKSTKSSERKQLAVEIQKLEDACEKVSNEVKKVNEKCINDFEEHLKSGTVRECIKEEDTNTINRFLGKYTYRWSSMEIRKADQTGYYEFCYTDALTTKPRIEDKWIPDNVKRNGTRAWIDGDILYVRHQGTTSEFELCEQGIENSGHLYVRI